MKSNLNPKLCLETRLLPTLFVRSLGAALLMATVLDAGAFEKASEALKSARDKHRAADLVGAIKDADEAIRLAGTNATERTDVLLFKAQVAEDQKDYAKALDTVAIILADAGANVNQKINAIGRKAGVLQKEGKTQEAVQAYLDGVKSPIFEAPADRLRVQFNLASFYERLKDDNKALEVYEQIQKDPGASPQVKMQALRNRAKLMISRYQFDEARAAYREVLAFPELKGRERATVVGDLAASFATEGDFEKAKQEYAKVIEVEGLSEQDKKAVSDRTMRFYRSCRDFAGIKSLFAALGGAKDQSDYQWLRDFAVMAETGGAMADANEAWSQALVLQNLSPKQYAEAAFGKMNHLAVDRNRNELAKLAAQVVDNAALEEGQRVSAELIKAGASSGKPGALTTGSLPKSSLDGQKTADAYAVAAKVFMRLGDFENARFLGEQADALFEKRSKPLYDCKFVEQAPMGVSGWEASPIVKDPSRREARFEPYNQAAAALLINDVNVTRSVVAEGKQGAGNAGFYMAGDSRGWHIYVDYKEEQANEVMGGIVGGGGLELYFAPGKGECYYQIMTEVPSGKSSVIAWTSPHRYYRKLDSYLQVQVAQVKGGFGIHFFIPWEVVYDKLPQEGDLWQFGLVNFTRQGGFTWGSGQVHELNRFGNIRFDGIDKSMPAIRRAIVMKAFSKYKESARGARRFWNDEVKGDRAFFEKTLLPEIVKLDELGKLVVPEMPQEDVDMLFAKAVPNWMEFDYFVAELRSRSLSDHLFSQAK